MDLIKVKQNSPSWWILAFQNKSEITCIVNNGELLDKQNIEKLIEKHGQFYEIFGEYDSQAIAEKAALEIEKQESLDPVFYPNKDTEKKYLSQLNNLNKDNSTIIDMGKLPPIYSALGIKDKELKTNVKAILKSQGFEGQNRHQIPEETINNLLPLVYNPKAIFKSLSDSQNPDAYIAVLDAKTDKQEQIIAILSPSKDGQGFTFIPSVYEKHNFERFLEKTHEEEKVLYVASKRKGSEIWGTLQLRPRHNSEPYINNIQDQGDIVKYFSRENQKIKEKTMQDNITRTENREDGVYKVLQSANGDILDEYCVSDKKSPAVRADENIINKENSMSDVNEQENYLAKANDPRDPKEEAFLNALHHRKVITEAMKVGNLCCLPGSDGYADTTPAINVASGTFYHGANMMFLKEHTRENAYPSAEYISSTQLEKIKEKNKDFFIRKGEKGISIYVSNKIEGTEDEWGDPQSIRLFNIAQTNKPFALKDYLVKEKEAYLQTQYGANYTYEPTLKKAGPDIICSSTDPVQYMGQYLAAVSIGSKFQVTKDQASEFCKNLETALYAKMDNGHSNPFSLSKISNEASVVCKDVIKEARMWAQNNEQPQQQQEQTQSLGHRR